MREIPLVHAVHLGEVVHAGEEHGGLDDLVEAAPRGVEHRLDRLAALLRLVGDRPGHQVAGRVGRDLAADEDEGRRADGLGLLLRARLARSVEGGGGRAYVGASGCEALGLVMGSRMGRAGEKLTLHGVLGRDLLHRGAEGAGRGGDELVGEAGECSARRWEEHGTGQLMCDSGTEQRHGNTNGEMEEIMYCLWRFMYI